MIEQVLRAEDGTAISAVHWGSGDSDLCFVVAHGFTGNWRQPKVQRVAARLGRFGSVVAIDMRGHGRSAGYTSLGDKEVLDVSAGVEWARSLGYRTVVSVGFSLGGAVVLRQGGLVRTGPAAVDAVVSVSAPAFWYYRGTRHARWVHRLVLNGAGRVLLRYKGVRVEDRDWVRPYPVAPHEAAALMGQMPLLVVHGRRDRYFPMEHANAIHRAAIDADVPAELWVEPDFDHAESGISDELLDRIGTWAEQLVVDRG